MTYDPSIYTMDHPKLTVSKQKEKNPLVEKGLTTRYMKIQHVYFSATITKGPNRQMVVFKI